MNPHDPDKYKDPPGEVSPEAKALRAYISTAVELLNSTPGSDDDGALIYLGNPHVAIPHQLLVCQELESDEKIIWALMREAIHRPGHPALLPTQKHISAQMGRTRRKINESIQVLRIRRWITLCAHAGRSEEGNWKRPIYAIHDEAIPLADALFLDESYLEYITRLASDNSVTRRVADSAREAAEQLNHKIDREDVSLSPGPVARSLMGYSSSPEDADHETAETADMGSENNRGYELPTVICQDEHGNNRGHELRSVKNAKKTQIGATICSSSSNKKTTTTTTANADFSETAHLVFPKALTTRETNIARGMVRILPEEQRQFALNYLRDRIADTTQEPLRNRLRYFNWLIEQLRHDGLGPSSYGLMDEEKPSLSLRAEKEESPEERMRRWRMQMREYGVEVDQG